MCSFVQLSIFPVTRHSEVHILARIARTEVFDPRDVAIVHVMNRVVRRCFLMGDGVCFVPYANAAKALLMNQRRQRLR